MRDLIDRQAAIDVLEEHLDYLQKLNKDDNPKAESEWYGVNWARNTIADLPSAQPEVLACGNGELDTQLGQRWIPVTERLPDKGLRVLMQLDNIWQIVGWYDMEDAQWFELISEEPLNPKYYVLAWMPLPDLYEEKEKKE